MVAMLNSDPNNSLCGGKRSNPNPRKRKENINVDRTEENYITGETT
jgi:hypothetical protein